jgi:hypothetical protein
VRRRICWRLAAAAGVTVAYASPAGVKLAGGGAGRSLEGTGGANCCGMRGAARWGRLGEAAAAVLRPIERRCQAREEGCAVVRRAVQPVAVPRVVGGEGFGRETSLAVGGSPWPTDEAFAILVSSNADNGLSPAISKFLTIIL